MRASSDASEFLGLEISREADTTTHGFPSTRRTALEITELIYRDTSSAPERNAEARSVEKGGDVVYPIGGSDCNTEASEEEAACVFKS